ncbi:putative sodiumalanine symporter protein [Salinisphaera shabanensis E1L3A]|uniref:Sodiumalanine symporter protein n=1 Tax=Salinisphaera shabanensis E1L3A TaxID=1033802 RepID=U2EK21_9GAMM|nr:sodium:alanine symporter family protein [Salinisphaera shabanensis]ERJ18340.1 putative sodiumalanine symporter protein [Salinisphaera shabanensis E1L3A]
METLTNALSTLSGWVWGPVMLILLLGTGIYLTVGLRGIPQRKLFYGFSMMFAGRKQTTEPGDITPFQALATALAATVGTGNIAGVATAIHLGGPGAIFWMWVTAIVGMATKYGEAVLAVKYRETNAEGAYVGGPMYYIRNGLGTNWKWLAFAFALFATIAAFGIGNTVQSNSVSQVFDETLSIPRWLTGLVMAAGVFAVIIGGVQRLASVTDKLVPVMAIIYVIGAAVVLVLNAGEVPGAIALIFSDAFTGTAATGGFAGAGIIMAIRFGVARGIFSNEAGLGSAPIAHAAARTDSPVRQGVVAMLGTFIDTIIVCTMTALVIISTGAWSSGTTGAQLSAEAFTTGMPGPGGWIVSFGLVIFAFSTMLAWSYYGERTAEYLFGSRIITPYRLLWVVAVFVGAIAQLDFVWLVADVMNALMAIPNLIALVLLAPVVFKLTRAYFDKT